MQVNGAGSLSPESEDIENSTVPVHLVYRAPTANHQPQYTLNTRKDRYHSVDGVSLSQVKLPVKLLSFAATLHGGIRCRVA